MPACRLSNRSHARLSNRSRASYASSSRRALVTQAPERTCSEPPHSTTLSARTAAARLIRTWGLVEATCEYGSGELAVRLPSLDRARLVTEETPHASRSGRHEEHLSLLIAELEDTR